MSDKKEIVIRPNKNVSKIIHTPPIPENVNKLDVYFDGGPVCIIDGYCEFYICKDGEFYSIKINADDLVDLLFNPGNFDSKVITDTNPLKE